MRNNQDDDPSKHPSPQKQFKNSNDYNASHLSDSRSLQQQEQDASAQEVQNNSNLLANLDNSNILETDVNPSSNTIAQIQGFNTHGLNEEIQIRTNVQHLDVSQFSFETVQFNNENEANARGLEALTNEVADQFEDLDQNHQTYANRLHEVITERRDEIIEINRQLSNNVGLFNWFGWNLTTLFVSLGILSLGIGSYLIWRRLGANTEALGNELTRVRFLLENITRVLDSSRSEIDRLNSQIQNLHNSQNRASAMFGWIFGGFALGGRVLFRFFKKWFF